MNTLWTRHALRPHRACRTCRTCIARNASWTLWPNVTLWTRRTSWPRISCRTLRSNIAFWPFTSGIALRANIPANALNALNALRPRITSWTCIASRASIASRPHWSSIASWASCAWSAGNALRSHRPLIPLVTFRSRTSGIAFHALRPHRPLISFWPRRSTLTTDRVTLILTIFHTAVTRIVPIHTKHILPLIRKRHLAGHINNIFFYK